MIAPLLIIAGTAFHDLKAQAHPGDGRVTLVGKQLSFAAIFRSIWEQTGMQAFYNDEQLSSAEKVDVNLKNKPLDQALSTLLQHRNLTWYYREETFVIMPAKGRLPEPEKATAPDQLTVSGIVTSPQGAPLAGATVLLKGSRQGTHTDENGAFTLSVQPSTKLVISSMGYDPKEILAGKENGEQHQVRLQPAVSGLDEVLVIAYGTASRRNLTGSVSRITAADIAEQPVSNALQAMQGRVTGLHITQTSGLPGGDYKVELRGRNSISSGNDPFYIVDGVPFTATSLSWALGVNVGLGANRSSSPLNLINVTDIASIDVLKDADATAIYGSRGANGVILITTRKGRPGKARADMNIYTGIGRVAHQVQYLNTPQYLQMRREAFRNDGKTPQPGDYDMFWDSTRYTNWQKEMIGSTAHVTDAQGTVSGGTDNACYAIGAGYRRESTVFPGEFNYQKAGVHMRSTFSTPDEAKRGKASIMVNYVTDQHHLPSTDLTPLSTNPPNTPEPYDEYGVLNWEHHTFDNPLSNLLKQYRANSHNLIASAVLSYEMVKGLQLKASLGYTRMQMEEVQTNPVVSLNPAFGNRSGYSFFASGTVNSWILEPQAIYERAAGEGQLNILVGMTFQQEVRHQEGMYATGYTSDALLEDITSAANIAPLGVVNARYRYNAVFGRVNYTWKKRYILNLTGRRDGSSRFGPGSRFANFGAVGAAWIFSGEHWMKALPFLSFGKLRGSYGVTGNDQIADYGYLDTYLPAPPYDGDRGLYATRLFNAAYGWEKNVKLEAGLEMGFARDRILIIANWYRNRSSNQLVNYTLPGITGFTSIRRNLPALIGNTGVELELSTTNISNSDLTWESSLNLSLPRNQLLAFPGLATSAYNQYYTIGQPLDIQKGAHITGVDAKGGSYVFEDMDGDGKFTTPNDYIYTKHIGTTLYGGIHNRVRYKRWELSLLFQFVKQQRYNYAFVYGTVPPGGPVNQPVTVLERWQHPGDVTGVQQFTQSYGSPAGLAFARATNSDLMVTDASFIRLKNFSCAYRLPEKWMRALRIRNSEVYIQGQNLFTITGYPGLDPETAGLVDIYPPLRMWTAGLRLGF